MKPMRLRLSAQDAKSRIEAALALEARPEFGAVHLVRSPEDFTPAMPEFVRAYMAHVFSGDHQTLDTV
jgi:hypothetical protein